MLREKKGVSEFLLGLEEIRSGTKQKKKRFSESFQDFQAPSLSSTMTFISFSCTIFNQTQNNDSSHSDYKTIIKKSPNLFPPRILRALQQRIFGLQLGQLPAQAVDFVL